MYQNISRQTMSMTMELELLSSTLGRETCDVMRQNVIANVLLTNELN